MISWYRDKDWVFDVGWSADPEERDRPYQLVACFGCGVVFALCAIEKQGCPVCGHGRLPEEEEG